MNGEKITMWILIVIAVLAILTVAAAYGAYLKTFHARRKRDVYYMPKQLPKEIADRTRALIRAFETVPFEEVEILSHDGLRLFARYYHVADGAPLHIQFHGYRSFALRDFCGGNPLVRGDGHNTLVVDQRAHGNSEGNTITFGVYERMDCLRWAEYAAKRFGKDIPIFLSGVSMGAATVLMATELPLPKNVVGVIADCPYSSPRAIIRKVIGDMKLPVPLAYPLVVFGGALFGKIRNLSKTGAVFAVRHAKIPILIIHGEADSFVPCEMSREIAAANPNIRLETFPDASHAQSYMVDVARYEATSRAFIRDCLDQFHNKPKEDDI